MSAPTPISAIVHSSTLVTAGVFVLMKFLDLFFIFGFFNFLKIFVCISFLFGGFMAGFEIDFKKIVAFSTIRQIRIIIYFLLYNFKIFCLAHMFFHAIFKSLIFGCAGLGFFYLFIDQNKFYFTFKSFDNSIKSFLFLRVFSMSGLLFSLSFFSKDFILE